MITRIKTFIGMQSLQVEAFVRNDNPSPDQLDLTLKWSVVEPRILTGVHLLLKEDYSRGRWTGKQKQTFQLGEFKKKGQWSVLPEQPFLLNIDLAISPLFNQLDQLHQNPLLRPLTAGLKWLENVRSTYYLEVTTTIQGAALPAVRRIELPGLVLA